MAKASLLELGREEIALLCGELEHAIMAHDEWVHQFHIGLVTDKKIPEHYSEKDSHLTCTFGDWLNRNRKFVEQNDDLKEIEAIHQLMHEEACKLSTLYNMGESIKVEDYDSFIEHQILLQKSIHHLEGSLKVAETMFDSLTGLFTRRAMNPLLEQEQGRIRRYGHHSSVVMVDLDHFKAVNDTYGHPAGDRVLHTVAEFFKEHIRPYDSIFRYGGEEFLICLPNSSVDDAHKAIDRIREGLSLLPIHIGINQTIRVTTSMGVANLSATQMIEASISEADQALYAAKDSGRNRVVIYNDSLSLESGSSDLINASASKGIRSSSDSPTPI